MNDFDTLLVRALDETVSFLGDTVLLGEVSCSAVVSDATFDEMLMDGGILKKRGLSVVIPKTPYLFPAIGQKLVYSGRNYRVSELSEDNVSFELTCLTDTAK